MMGIVHFLSMVASVSALVVSFDHPGVPAMWEDAGRALPDSIIDFTVAVTQNAAGKASLTDLLLRRSDPESTEYGQWLSRDAVDALVAPDAKGVEAVRAWLNTSDVTSTGNGDFLMATMTVAEAEALLGGAHFHTFTHVDGVVSVVRLLTDFSLPATVAASVDFLGPTFRFPVVLQRKKRTLNQIAGPGVYPKLLRKLMNATDAVGTPGTKNIQACASFLKQYYSPSDLKIFFRKYAADAKITTPMSVVGPNDPTNRGIEAQLDTQYIMGVGRDTPTQFWSTRGKQPHNPENEPFLKWLFALANVSDTNMPKTMSASYGDNEPGVDIGYATRVNVEFQKAGVRGMSIMFSSGDGGVAGGQSQQCTTFVATFPAGSPWVTAVGGTTKSDPEVCASFSSGGFSNYWARPAYQDAAIQGYLHGDVPGLPAPVLYNASGAGIPDVAAQGENFDVVNNGKTEGVAGTSCSSPTFTAIVGLLNDARLAAGKSSLGWLNPWIYKTAGPAGGFNDITLGSNPGCGTPGFPASKGWDPVTGWGTPNYGALKALALALP